MTTTPQVTRPITFLLAALGGEGGGVLTDWIVSAARAAGYPVQSTSIPGVAQRTGATTYYIEIWPEPASELNGRSPIFSLNPAMGEVDVLAATEFLEAGRAIQQGFVTPERTTLIVSTHRVFVTLEKMEMADGRFDSEKLMKAAKERSRELVSFDMEATAAESGAMLNAVMLGAVIGSGKFPMDVEFLEDAIKSGGKTVDSNLNGFRTGLAIAKREMSPVDRVYEKRRDPAVNIDAMLAEARTRYPEAAHEVLGHALKRLADYQDPRYARAYLDRLDKFASVEPALLVEIARLLAVRMTYEDVIRVAQLKTRPDRLARIRAETGAGNDDPVIVTEFLKPRIDEICDVLPYSLGKAILGFAEKRPRLKNFSMGMEFHSTTLWGYGRLRALASMRGMRRMTYRYRCENEAIDAWLSDVEQAAAKDTGLAREITLLAGLIKGYGDTHARGSGNYARIRDALVAPALAGDLPANEAADLIRKARGAALEDPDGKKLGELLAETPIAAAANAGKHFADAAE